MAELERELLALGRALDFPAEPDLAPAVRVRLAERPRERFTLTGRRGLALALAVVAIAIAAAFAVPSARTAILRWLGLDHVRVVRVDRLPRTRKLDTADLGMKTTLAAAARAAGFRPIRLRHARVTAVYVQTVGPTPRLTLVYGPVAKPRLLLTEFRGVGASEYAQKLIGPGTTVERVEVHNDQGIFVSGKPHAILYALPGQLQFTYEAEPLLAGNTLAWQHDALTFRLEGNLGKNDAIRLAESAR